MCLLVNYFTGLFNDANVDGMANSLTSFNIDKVLNDQEDINMFKVAFGNDVNNKVRNVENDFNQVVSIF